MKSKLSKLVFSGALCFISGVGSVNAATIIVPNTPTSNVAADAGSTLAGLVNGNQLSATVGTGSDTAAALLVTHTSATLSNNYVSPGSGSDYFDAGTVPVLTFTLGSAYDFMDSIIIWNYAMVAASNNPPNNALKSFDLEFFSDAAATISLGSETGLTVARSLGGSSTVQQVAQQVFFSAQYSGVQAVKMTLTDNYSGQAGGLGGDRVGLGEVRFSQVPEPSTAILGGLGILGLLRRRRC